MTAPNAYADFLQLAWKRSLADSWLDLAEVIYSVGDGARAREMGKWLGFPK